MMMPKTPCILIAEADILIKRALASLMILGGNFEVVVSEAMDISELANDIFKIKPDIVFFSVSTSFAGKDSLSQLILRHSGLKVVLVNEDSNWLHIFKHEDKLLTCIEDLLLVINSA